MSDAGEAYDPSLLIAPPRSKSQQDHCIELFFEVDYDVFRDKHPKKQAYTWWTYRNNCRERDIGWRIDYFLVTEELKDRVKKVDHQKNMLGSDHCPIILDLDL